MFCMKLYPILFILVCYIIPGGCISANNDTEVCNESYYHAEMFIAQYAEKSEITYLHSALASLDTALKCNNTRLKSINLAISIYLLSKEYDIGKRFIDSLQMQDFTLS